MRVTHRVKRVPVTLYLAVVQPASRSLGKIGSASIDHASRWDLGRSSSLHSSTNGKTGIHVNGLRGLCRPLPPHSFLLLLLLLILLLFLLFLSRLSFFLSLFLFPSLIFCSCHDLCSVFISPFARTTVLPLSLLHSFSVTFLLSDLYIRHPDRVVRWDCLLTQVLKWLLAPRFLLDALVSFTVCGLYELSIANMCICVCVCIRSLMRFHLKSRQCHARLSTRISYRRIRDNGLGGKAAEYIDGTKWRVGEKEQWQWDSRLVSKSY